MSTMDTVNARIQTLALEISRVQKHFDVTYLEKIPSTNDFAKENLDSFTRPQLILASHQTSGRGRSSHQWEDTPAHGLLSSWVWPQLKGPAQPQWSLLFGWTVARAMEAAFPKLAVAVKAPNDIYLDGKKTGGILLEAISTGKRHGLVLGLGVNLWAVPFAGATSLAEALARQSMSLDLQMTIRATHTLLQNLVIAESMMNDPHWSLEAISEELCVFLNRAPHHAPNPVQRVSREGNLHLERGQIQWSDL